MLGWTNIWDDPNKEEPTALDFDYSPARPRFMLWNVSPLETSKATGPHKINIVINWFEELKRRVPVK